jgi:tetratricopeptide (TPR) repeat protein
LLVAEQALVIKEQQAMLRATIVILAFLILPTSELRAQVQGMEDAQTCDKKSDQEGIDACTRSIKLYPKLPFAYYNRGTNYLRSGQIDLAIADYTTAIELQPTDTAFYNNRGTAYDRKKEHDKAIADYTTAIKIDPAYRNAYLNRGLSHTSKGNIFHSQKNFIQARIEYELASDDLLKATKLSPNDGRAQNAVSINEEARRKNDKAIEGSLGGR